MEVLVQLLLALDEAAEVAVGLRLVAAEALLCGGWVHIVVGLVARKNDGEWGRVSRPACKSTHPHPPTHLVP